MNRGGYRPGAGRKAGWRHGATQTIRVPVALREELLEIARQLDNREFIGKPTYSQLNNLLGEWQRKWDNEPSSSIELLEVRQLINEIRELISPEIEADEWENDLLSRGEGCCHRHGRHHQKCQKEALASRMSVSSRQTIF